MEIEMHRCTTNFETHLYSYGSSLESGTSLALLRAIEVTVDVLKQEQHFAEAMTQQGRSFIQAIQSEDCNGPLDREGELSATLLKAEEGLETHLDDLNMRRQSALMDPNLNGDHEDAITMEYDRTISRFETLHATTMDLRWQIMENDADFDELEDDKIYSADELIAELKK